MEPRWQKASKMCPTMSSPKALTTHILRVFGPKDHTKQGFWALLSLRVLVGILDALGARMGYDWVWGIPSPVVPKP